MKWTLLSLSSIRMVVGNEGAISMIWGLNIDIISRTDPPNETFNCMRIVF
jgi:hypothetical protein